MSLLKNIWQFSGSLKIKDYSKIMSFINGLVVFGFIAFYSIEEIRAISPALNYLHETNARDFILSRIGYLVLFLVLGVAYLLLNIRFYPFVQSWVTSTLFKKPRMSQSISQARRDYQKGYNKNQNRQTHIKVQSKVEKDMLGNVKWEKDFAGNIKTDLTGVPTPKITTETTQTIIGNSRSFNGTKKAYEGLAVNGTAYIIRMLISLLLWLLSWYISFALGWIAVSKCINNENVNR